MKQRRHASVGHADLLGVFNARIRVERRQREKSAAAAFLHLVLQFTDPVAVADRTGIELVDLCVGPAQIMDDERANSKDCRANRQAGQRKAVPFPE